MLVYITCYLLISIAIIVALFLKYVDTYEDDDSYIEIGCGEEYKIIMFIIIGILWPLVFALSILIVIINFVKNVYNMCYKRFTRKFD